MAKAKLILPSYTNSKISGKRCCELYLQLKQHFSGNRDVVKYNWKFKFSDVAYLKRKDKFFFERLANKFGFKELCFIFIGNLISNQDTWVGEISDCNPVAFYHQYIAKLRNLDTRYEDDIKSLWFLSKKLNLSLNELFEYNEKTKSSVIFQMIQKNLISFESILMLDSFLDIINKHDCFDNILWQSYSTKFKAYRTLFKVDSMFYESEFNRIIDNI